MKTKVGPKLGSKHHNMTGTRVHEAWLSMKRRCAKKSGMDYGNYGLRGITVCPEWLDSFLVFFGDMGHPPHGLSLDRIDNNGSYHKLNCRWADSKTQQNNTRQTILITMNGVTKPFTEWAELSEINTNTLRTRLKRGWIPEKAFTQSPRSAS